MIFFIHKITLGCWVVAVSNYNLVVFPPTKTGKCFLSLLRLYTKFCSNVCMQHAQECQAQKKKKKLASARRKVQSSKTDTFTWWKANFCEVQKILKNPSLLVLFQCRKRRRRSAPNLHPPPPSPFLLLLSFCLLALPTKKARRILCLDSL